MAPASKRVVHTPPLARLIKRRQLDYCESAAACEILSAHHISIGVDRPGDSGVPAGFFRPDGADAAAAHRVDLLRTYSRWRSDLRGREEMSIALGLIIEQRPLRDLDAENRWRKGTAKGKAIAAIRHFAALRGNIPAGATERWKMTP